MRPSTSESPYDLLRLLADGRFHSGNELAGGLQCLPHVLPDRIRDLHARGWKTEVAPGPAYRLAERLDLLHKDELEARLAQTRVPFHLEIVDECRSTNSVLLAKALQGAPHASVLACESQSAGRGRRGNQWLAAIGGSLAFSLLWRFKKGAGALSGLSLAVAVGAVRALDALGIEGVSLKWPNDLLLGGRKLGGILIEMNGEFSGPSAAVIGIGINVKLPAALLKQLPQAIDLRHVPDLSRTALLAAQLEHIAAVLDEFSSAGFAALRQEWQARHAWQGLRVALQLANEQVAEGEAMGVDDDGALLLRLAAGVQRFHSGELSLRRA